MTFFKTQIPTSRTQASVDEYKSKLKDEYRRLTHEHHPDKGGLESEFIVLTGEYETLMREIDVRHTNTDTYKHSGITNAHNPNDIILGVERTIRKQRAVEPQHVEMRFNMTLDELDKGIIGQELKYQRRVYSPEHNTPSIQEVTLSVNLYSWQLNAHDEIVFSGYGDQGLLGDKADLILKINLEDANVHIDYEPTLLDPQKAPCVVDTMLVPMWDTELKTKILGVEYIFPLTDKTSAITKRGVGLRFRRGDGTLIRGDYKIKIMRYS